VGTLIALREPVGETYARLARRHGVRVPAWRLEDAFARVMASAPALPADADPSARAAAERSWWRDRVRETFRAADQLARFDDFEAFFEALWVHYAGAAGWRLVPGAARALAALRAAGLRLGLVSNADARLEGVLEALGLGGAFDAVVRGAEAGAPKPDARPFALCLARLGVAPERALFVGDRAREDVEAARAAGLRAVLTRDLATLPGIPAPLRALAPEEP
jgi:putative hydrolase of the HAD superfamily